MLNPTTFWMGARQTVHCSTRRMKAFSKIASPYAMLFFDHLYSEYLALKQFITEPEVRELLERLREKRVKCGLASRYIYTFD